MSLLIDGPAGDFLMANVEDKSLAGQEVRGLDRSGKGQLGFDSPPAVGCPLPVSFENQEAVSAQDVVSVCSSADRFIRALSISQASIDNQLRPVSPAGCEDGEFSLNRNLDETTSCPDTLLNRQSSHAHRCLSLQAWGLTL